MGYPEKNANYRNKPAWMDRAVAGEKRAEGGAVDAVSKASRDLNDAIRNDNSSNEGESRGRESSRKRLSSDPFEAMAAGAGRKRADGGRADDDKLVDPQGFAIDDPQKSSFGPPQRFTRASSPRAAEDAREQAAHRMRNTRAMPNSFLVGGEKSELRTFDEHLPRAESKEPHKRGGRVRRADGGMARSGMKPTDPTVSQEDVKTWGSADNARAAARAREHAAKNPLPADKSKEIEQQMSRQSSGFKRGGRA